MRSTRNILLKINDSDEVIWRQPFANVHVHVHFQGCNEVVTALLRLCYNLEKHCQQIVV